MTHQAEETRGLMAGQEQILFEAIFANSTDAIGVSEAGTHTLVNPSYVRLFGYDTAEQLIGRSILELIAPSAREDILDRVRRRSAGAEVPMAYETRGLRRDGTEFDMDVRAAAHTHDGRVFTLVILRDITHAKTTERVLRETSEFYRAMFDDYPMPKLLIDPGMQRVVEANTAALEFYGYAREELRGKPMAELNVLPPERVAAEMNKARLRQRTLFSFQHRMASGELRDVDVYSAPVEWQGRTYLLSSVMDASERRLLEQQLLQAQKMEAVGQLAGAIAHDFNNYLTAMLGFSVVVEEEGDPALRPLARHVTKAAQRAAELTRQLLAFSRRQVLQPQVVDLNQVARDALALLRPAMGPQVKVEVDLVEDLGRVRADPAQLQQVLMNLAVNAKDAMPRGGRLTVRTRNDGADHVVLEVADTGMGMDEVTQARVFEPFFTTKEKGRGTGLGLSTAYGIIRQSEGTIRVASTPGAGSVFTLTFPRVEAPLPTAPSPQSDGAPDEELRGRTLLIAEDEAGVRAFLARGFSAAGCKVWEAENGRQALEVAAAVTGPLDLVITDVVMPELDGPGMVRELRRARPDIPVVFVSGYPGTHLSNPELTNQPRTAFLAKPFQFRDLERAVAALLVRNPA